MGNEPAAVFEVYPSPDSLLSYEPATVFAGEILHRSYNEPARKRRDLGVEKRKKGLMGTG